MEKSQRLILLNNHITENLEKMHYNETNSLVIQIVANKQIKGRNKPKLNIHSLPSVCINMELLY